MLLGLIKQQNEEMYVKYLSEKYGFKIINSSSIIRELYEEYLRNGHLIPENKNNSFDGVMREFYQELILNHYNKNMSDYIRKICFGFKNIVIYDICNEIEIKFIKDNSGYMIYQINNLKDIDDIMTNIICHKLGNM